MKKAYSYIRFSTPEQAKGRSYERQWKECLKWCNKNGYDLAENEEYIFFDKGVSAFRGQHADVGQLGRFLSLVEDGTIEEGSTLIVESLDRLGRDHVKLALPRFIDLLNKGINVVTLADGRMYTSDYTEMELIISISVMARAHEESSTKSGRIRDAWEDKHDLAKHHKTPIGNTAPLWLEFKPKDGLTDSKAAIRQGSYVINEERANIVRRIFQMTIDGYGRGVIAKALNQDGIKSFKGKTWGISSVAKVLGNKAVLGFYQPMHMKRPLGEPIANYFEPIIDEETFYRAQEATNARRISGATKQSKRFQVWQGLAMCSKCCAPMHFVDKGRPPKGNTYLVCANNRKGTCGAKSVRAEPGEQVFREILAKVDSLPLIQDSYSKIEKELLALEGKLAERRIQYDELKQDLDQRYSKAVVEAIYKVEKELDTGAKKVEELKELLATNRIVDRERFFEKLDLESYEGRYRANALLKRLGIYVFVQGGQEPVFVAHRPEELWFPGTPEHPDRILMNTHSPFLQLVVRKSGVVLVPIKADQRTKFREQDKTGEDSERLDDWFDSLGLFPKKTA